MKFSTASTTSILLATFTALIPTLISAQTSAHCSPSFELCKTLQLTDAHSALSIHVPGLPLDLKARGGSGDWTMMPAVEKDDVEKMTNGERFKRGLGPAKPKRRGSPTRRQSPVPSPAPLMNFRGRIKVLRPDTGAPLGFVSKFSLARAQLRYSPNEDDALLVSFGLPVGQTSGSGLELTPENVDIANFPFLSLVQGRDSTSPDVGSGSFSYLYLGTANPSTTPSTVGNSYSQATGTQRTSETPVFNYDSKTSALTVTYRNTDGSTPALSAFTQSNALYFGGDMALFTQRYPAQTIPISFVFEQLM